MWVEENPPSLNAYPYVARRGRGGTLGLSAPMRRILVLALVVLGFGGAIASQAINTARAQGDHAALVEIDGAIQPISARFLARAIDTAAEDNAEVLIILLDTPGGLLDSTREMVEAILASGVPVVVYVSPAGAEATSAGTFITAAAHVAAMAPSTNIGAAAPVSSTGEELPDTVKSKASEAAAAFIRSIAEERGRNADALEATVVEAKAYTASEALDNGIIDLVVRDVPALLEALDGRQVDLERGTRTLETESIPVRQIEPTALDRFLGIIADPNIAFILLALGALGILIEVMSPGLIGPGALGVIALALAFVAIGNLPVNWVGVGLLVFAMVLFLVEVQAPGIGVFGVAGAVSFVLGAFFLFGGISPPPITTPSFRVDPWLLGAVSVVLFALLALSLRTLAVARKTDYVSPSSNVVGQAGKVVAPLEPRGTVRVNGESWTAESLSGQPIAEGAEIIVMEVEGLTLKVSEAVGPA